MTSNILYKVRSLIITLVFVSRTDGGMFFQKEGTSSLLPPGVKDYHAFPVKLVRVTNTVAVPVPYPVHITKKVPYPVTVTKPVPYPVPHPIPVHVTKPFLIQQAVPVPLIKPILPPTASALTQSQGKNNYLNFIGYHNYGTRPLYNHHQTNPAAVSQTQTEQLRDFRSDSFDHLNAGNNFGQISPNHVIGFTNNNYNNYDTQLHNFAIPSEDMLPPSLSAEFGSNEFGSNEPDTGHDILSNNTDNDDNEEEDEEEEEGEDNDGDQGTDATNKAQKDHQGSDESSQVDDNVQASKEKV